MRFIAGSIVGSVCTVYGTIFGLTYGYGDHFLPGQPWYAVALLFVGFLLPIACYYLTTDDLEMSDEEVMRRCANR